ncbi:M28 family metallopeptidase [Dawidia soli]|uniref:M20/M25/M40 family metallo-hydrolase n=1 Tax=Dawidia soli TaxID=2782352 RepID=A0AAP2GF00_9BACT|nr:M28 family metallopeptidase [Dawidia soli]MBT1688972.1 M20/M25/M40 family metallo-hydrolase [Dawidia soli]
MSKSTVWPLALLLLLASCKPKHADPQDGLASFTEAGYAQHVKTLASDDFQGRRPFTAGEKKTLAYLVDEFKQLGLEAGNDTSFLQEVPMVEITTKADSVMHLTGPTGKTTLSGLKEYVLWTQRTDSLISWRDAGLVFAGFGIVAPEYHWNDYQGLDVKGKIVVVLVNDPGFGGNDTTFFKGNTMTYYGRWTYKYEEAARQGARGCLIVHNTVPAAYPFGVVQNNWNSPHLYLDQRGHQLYVCEGVGWVSFPAAEKLFQLAGLNLNEQQTRARKPGFTAVDMNVKASTTLHVKTRFDKSYNVIAKLTGSEKPDEYILYTAHWDHLGIGKPNAVGDSIYNGAHDNASGTAALLEIAKAFKSLQQKPRRTVVFLAVTAEEQGLWGSAYYAEHPVYPAASTVANLNMDGINPYGKMKDVVVIGKGQSELEDYLADAASQQGRYVVPDSEPEKGYYFRSDHFNFAKIGIPALYTGTGNDHAEKGKEYGARLKSEYTRLYYHQPTDEYDSARLNTAGALEDIKLLFQVGKRLAAEDAWPAWKEGSEFKAAR